MVTYLEQLRAEHKARRQRLWGRAGGKPAGEAVVDGKQSQASIVPLERDPARRARMARLECEMKGLVLKALEGSQR